MKPIRFLLLVAVLALPALVQAETVFKWVDANGVTNYTTTPPPAGVHKVAAVNATPAVSSTYPAMAGEEEARYWRERRQREAFDNMRDSRQRQDMADLRQSQVRQDLAQRYDQEQRARAEEARRQAIFDQCQLERRVDCDTYGYGYGTPVVVAHRRAQPITFAAPFPVPGSPLVTNPTPGAPSLNVSNGTPGAFTMGSTPVASSTRRTAERGRSGATR